MPEVPLYLLCVCVCSSIETPSALCQIPQQSCCRTQFFLHFFPMKLNDWKCILVFVSTHEQWLCQLAPAKIWYHEEDKVDDEVSDNISVQIRQSNQTFFLSPTRGNVQFMWSWLNVSDVERKQSWRQKRSRCKKESRCLFVPFVLSFLLSRLANISFFTPIDKTAECVLSFPSSNSSSAFL